MRVCVYVCVEEYERQIQELKDMNEMLVERESFTIEGVCACLLTESKRAVSMCACVCVCLCGGV